MQDPTNAHGLTPEEDEAFRLNIESSNERIGQFDREIRALQAKRTVEVTMRDSLIAKLGLNGAAIPLLPVKPVTMKGVSTVPTGGLSETIRAIIYEAGRSMKPPAVAAELRKREFPYQATTPLVTRVGNEMRRMMKAGMLTKHGGKYGIASHSRAAVNGSANN